MPRPTYPRPELAREARLSQGVPPRCSPKDWTHSVAKRRLWPPTGNRRFAGRIEMLTLFRVLAIASLAGLAAMPAAAQKVYGPGVSDSEIKIGNTAPYSGPASAYGASALSELAYFRWLNEEKGGVNGRKIIMVSLDDGYSPPKTVEQMRRLVENENVLLIFNP